MTITIHGQQLVYHGTRSELDALTGLVAGTNGLTSDTGELGWYDGTAWHWVNKWDDIENKPTFGNELFFHQEAGSISGYKSLEFSPANDPETSGSAAVTSGTSPVLMQAFILDQDFNAVLVPSGEYLLDVWAEVNAASGAPHLDFRFYKRAVGGTETLLFTMSTPSLTSTPTEYNIETVQPNLVIDPTDRIVVKIYALTTSSGSRTITFYYEGVTRYSHIHVPWTIGGGAPLGPPSSGDMLQSTYDVNGNGIVDNAEAVGSVGLSGLVQTGDSRLTDARTPTAHDNTAHTTAYAPVASPTFTGTVGGITPTMVGLGNVNNTSDASKPVSTATQSALDLKSPITSPTFLGTPAAPAPDAGTNTAQIATTAYAMAAAPNPSYRTLAQAMGSHIAGKIAGTYMIPMSNPLAVSGTGVLYPIALIPIYAADLPTVNGLTTKLRIRAIVSVNNVAPTGNFTVGLYPITSGAGGTGLKIYTVGSLVTGSAAPTVTTPAGSSMSSVVGSDFALPSDGVYCLAVVTTGTIATNSLVEVNAVLQVHNA